MELSMVSGFNRIGFEELNEYEMIMIDGGGFWDTAKDAAVGALAGAVVGFGQGVIVGALVGLTMGGAGVVAGAVSCGLYYAGRGAVTGAVSNAAVQGGLDLINAK